MVRRTYGSMTIYQDETAFTNRGTVTIANFRPNIFKIERQTPNPPPSVRFAKLPGYTNKTKYQPVEHFTDITDMQRINNLTLETRLYYDYFIIIDNLPSSESAVMNASAKSTTRMLRDGAFITSRMAQDVTIYRA